MIKVFPPATPVNPEWRRSNLVDFNSLTSFSSCVNVSDTSQIQGKIVVLLWLHGHTVVGSISFCVDFAHSDCLGALGGKLGALNWPCKSIDQRNQFAALKGDKLATCAPPPKGSRTSCSATMCSKAGEVTVERLKTGWLKELVSGLFPSTVGSSGCSCVQTNHLLVTPYSPRTMKEYQNRAHDSDCATP